MLSLSNLLSQSAEPGSRWDLSQPAQNVQSAWGGYAQQAPQEVLDYYKGYNPSGMGDASQMGGWYADSQNQDPMKRYYKDSNGYLWIPNWTGQEAQGDAGTGNAGSLAGYRMGLTPGERPGLRKGTDYYYDPTGKFAYMDKDDPGWLNPVTGVLAVATLGAAGYLGALGGEAAALGAGETAGGATSLAGTYGGSTGAGFGQIGLGAGSGSAGAGYGAGLGMGSTYGGASIGSGLATGAGAAGAAAGMTGTPPPANPYTGNTLGNMFSGNNLATQAAKMGLGQLLNGGGGGNGGSGGSGSTGGGMNIPSWLLGANDAYQQNKAGQTMIDWLGSQQNKMEGYMSPNSPEWQSMWDQMSRKDAAAGRNSQYGPRTADFLANVAKAKAGNTLNFTTGTSRGLADALTQRANARSLPGLGAVAGQNSLGGNNGWANLISQIFGSGGSTPWGVNTGDSALNLGTSSNDEIWDMINGGGYNINDWYY